MTKWNEDVATEDFLDGSYDEGDKDPGDDKERHKRKNWWKKPDADSYENVRGGSGCRER